MIQKVKDMLATLDSYTVGSFIFFLGMFIFGCGLFIYIFSAYGAIVGTIFLGIVLMIIGSSMI